MSAIWLSDGDCEFLLHHLHHSSACDLKKKIYIYIPYIFFFFALMSCLYVVTHTASAKTYLMYSSLQSFILISYPSSADKLMLAKSMIAVFPSLSIKIQEENEGFVSVIRFFSVDVVTTSVVSFRMCSCASLLDAQLSLFSSGLPQIGISCLPFEKAARAVFVVD